MLNQVIIVGRLVKDPEIRSTNEGKKVTNITLAVNRSYKNSEGKYDTDFINCTLWETIAQATVDHCKKGSILGVKGRITTKFVEVENSKKISFLDLVAENITFISNKNKEVLQEGI